MTNDQEVLEPQEVEGAEGGEVSEKAEEKPKLTPDQIRGIKQRNFTKLAKELGVELPKESEKSGNPIETKQSFDYAEMAYLEAKGISEDDYPIVLEAIRSTGKSLRDALGNKYLQTELKEAKENRSSKDAIPSGSKRSSPTSVNTVEYHLAKGTPLSKIEDRQLRHKVRQAKEKAAGADQMFAD